MRGCHIRLGEDWTFLVAACASSGLSPPVCTGLAGLLPGRYGEKCEPLLQALMMRPLLRFDDAAKRHPRVESWLAAQGGTLGDLAREWFEELRRCGDDVVEVLHDGQPTACVDGAAFAYVDVFTAHMSVGFFQGAELPDPAGILQGSGKYMRHVKLRRGRPVDADALLALIQAAYADVKDRLANE